MDGINVKDLIQLDPALLQQLEELKQKALEAAKALREGIKNGDLSKEAMKKLEEGAKVASDAYENLKNSLTGTQQEQLKFIETQSNMAKAFGASGQIVNLFTSGLQTLVSSMSSSAQVLGVMGSDLYRQFVNPLQDANLTLLKSIPGFGKLDEAMQNLKDTQNVARVSSILLGESLGAANEKAKEYPTYLRESAAVTGIAAKEINEMNAILQQVPGALSLTGEGFAGIAELQGRSIETSAALGVTLRAFGMDSSAAANLAKDAWFGFGQTAEETIKQMGLIADASKKTGVDRKTAADQIKDASSSLAIFGQKTGSASSMWTTFMQNLSNTIPINEVQKMVKGLIEGIANMSVEARAFMGMMSGITSGQTALGGALQLELALRPGADEATRSEGLQKHMQGLTDTLARFTGGQVITLEQAAHNPQLEVQFQLQRQMLGKLTGITNQEQQNRVLEVLQGVRSGGMAAIEGTQALQEVYEQGASVADQQLSALKRIEQVLRTGMGDLADKQLEAADTVLRSDKLSAMGSAIGRSSQLKFAETQEATNLMRDMGEMLGNAPEKFLKTVENVRGETTQKDIMNLTRSFAAGLTGEKAELKEVTPRQPGEKEVQATIQKPRIPGEQEIQATITAKSPMESVDNSLLNQIKNVNVPVENITKSVNSVSDEFNSLAVNMNKINQELKNFAAMPSTQPTKETSNMDKMHEEFQMVINALNETKNNEIFTPDVPKTTTTSAAAVNNQLQARIENIQGESNTNIDVVINVNGNSNMKIDENHVRKNIQELMNGITGWNEK